MSEPRSGADPRVGVVIPTLNEESTIAGCLESVGSDPRIAVVVSDGGSRDRTLEILATHPGVRLVKGSPGRGIQLNRGSLAVAAPILVFLHADCRLPAGWVEAVESGLLDPGTSLLHFTLHTEPTRTAGRWRRRWIRLLDLRSLGFGLPYGDQGFCVRSADFGELGGFPEIPLMEDLAFARACSRRGAIRRLPLEIRTTARRFERRPFRARLMTAVFPWLFRLGVSPSRLASWYGEVR